MCRIKIVSMPRANLYLKVEIEYNAEDPPEKISAEVCRVIEKLYPVRSAEVSSVVPVS